MTRALPLLAVLVACADPADDGFDAESDAVAAALEVQLTATTDPTDLESVPLDNGAKTAAGCLDLPTLTDVEWVQGRELAAWGYELVWTDCSAGGPTSVSGSSLITFGHLAALSEDATAAQIAGAAANDLAALEAGELDVQSETELHGAFGSNLWVRADATGTDSSSSRSVAFEGTATTGATVSGSWDGTAGQLDGVTHRDGSGELTVEGDRRSHTATFEASGLLREDGDAWPSSGSITYGFARGELTVTFDADTPNTGEAELTTPRGRRTLVLPVP